MEVSKYEVFVRETSAHDFYNRTIRKSEDVYKFATDCLQMDYMGREHVIVIAVDAALNIIGYSTESIGELSGALISPREIMKFLILGNASGAVILHNHPSGNPTPSTEDVDATKRLQDVFRVMGIKFIDHIIIGHGKYKSMKEDGYI